MAKFEIMLGTGENAWQIIEAGNPWQACVIFLQEYLLDKDFDNVNLADQTHSMFLITILDCPDFDNSHFEIPLFDIVAILALAASA